MMSERARECYEKFLANAALANRLEQQIPQDGGWNCVVRFYAALHLINAFLIDKRNVKFDTTAASHQDRKKAMEKCPELRDAPYWYRELKDLSGLIRYDASFTCAAEHCQKSKSLLAKIIAIIEPKLKK